VQADVPSQIQMTQPLPVQPSRFVRALIGVALVLATGGWACAGDPEARKRAFLESGDRYADQGNLRAAVIEYRNAIQIDPRFAAARVRLAGVYEQLGDPNALSEYVRASDLLPEDDELQLKTGHILLRAGRTDDALARADVVLRNHPESVDAYVLRGNALGGLDNLDQAVTAMEEALRLDPSRGATYVQLGLVEFARGRQIEAEAAFVRAIELAPQDVSAHLALANLHWSAGRLPDAERSLEDALAIEPSHAGANRAMAVFCLATGRVDRAERYLKALVDTSGSADARFALADYYVAARRFAEAIALLDAMMADPRTSNHATERLARAHAAAGDRERAHALAEGLLARAPDDAAGHLLRSQLLLEDARRDEALASARAAVAADPASARAHFALGRLYAARGDVPGAEAAFREVLRVNPGAIAAHVELSRLQLAGGAATTSLRTAEQAVRLAPGDPRARLALVRGLLAARDLARAQREIESLLSVHPNLPEAHAQNGVLGAARGQTDAARRAFERALELDRASVEGLAGLLALDLNTGHSAAAAARIRRHLEFTPESPELLLLAARTYASAGEFEAAEASLRRTIDLNPSLLPAYGLLARQYLSQGRLAEARHEFDSLAGRQSRPAGSLTMSGVIAQAQGETAAARQRYEKAVAADPEAAVAANNLAWIYAQSGERLDQALRLALTAAELLPDSPEALDTLGWAYYRNDLPAMAVPPLLRCLEKDPRKPVCHYHLGLAHAGTGDAPRAAEALEQALALGGQESWSGDARRALAAVRHQAGR
jgi:tetratricopeptide (TPR) repeat protein